MTKWKHFSFLKRPKVKEEEKDFLYWAAPLKEVFHKLSSSPEGLSLKEVRKRRRENKQKGLLHRSQISLLQTFLSQFGNPLTFLLLVCAFFSFFSQDKGNSLIILGIVIISGLLGFWQEYKAGRTISKLLNLVHGKISVWRQGRVHNVPLNQLFPGDIIFLQAGNNIPRDGLIIECTDFFIDESSLTGESIAVEKRVAMLDPTTPLAQRSNSVFMGTQVVSGKARILIVADENRSVLGQMVQELSRSAGPTEFEEGIRKLGYLLLEITLFLTGFIFALNIYLERPFFDALLFALAVAVGMTPQLLPAVISINLSHGAKHMAKKQVIVRKLASIENFGSMNILCSDKTGTLTEGKMRIHSCLNSRGNEEEKVGFFAYLNAFFYSGFKNPIDVALLEQLSFPRASWKKLGEIPYDFFRKRITLCLSENGDPWLITKGAFDSVASQCAFVEIEGRRAPFHTIQKSIHQQFEELSQKGFRVLSVAYRKLTEIPQSLVDEEKELTFLGFLVLEDPLKEGVIATIHELTQFGVSLKIVTGDNRFVSTHIGQKLFQGPIRVLTGSDLSLLSDRALFHQIQNVHVFAEVDPNQKERLIHAFRKRGNVVGYLGDGINDLAAMHAADISISVQKAAESAKEEADIVLLKRSLKILLDGVKMGRLNFANTLKYVFMATSANFGNMFSMAFASLFLPFLPLLPKQVLLNNLLTDLPELAIATDRVDSEMLQKPLRWNVKAICRFMLVFGLTSSIFDTITFVVLLYALKATPDQFRSGWFLESVLSAILIVLVIRTRRTFFKSAPSWPLIATSLGVSAFLLIIPFTPLISTFGFAPLPLPFFGALFAILSGYMFTAEVVKKLFYKFF
jgi:P-type Mg2+ transporter